MTSDEEMKRSDEEEGKPQIAIKGENLVVKVTSVFASLTVFGWGIWWASGVQSDLNSIKVTLSNFNRIDSLTARVSNLEQYGTPKSYEIEKRVNELEKRYEIDKVRAAKP